MVLRPRPDTLATPSRLPPIDPRLRNVKVEGPGYLAVYKHLTIIGSEAMELDGKWWLHASCSRRDRGMPTYDDLMILKDLAIGKDRTAVQVFPPADKHVDIAGKMARPIQVLHLWSCAEQVLPDFTRGGTQI